MSLTDIDDIVNCLPKESADNVKRQLRKPLLLAYDSHKTTVIYEDKAEKTFDKQRVLLWKQDLLDLKTDAFRYENVPDSIKYFYK